MHATALTDEAINLLKRQKTSKYLFQNVQNFKNGKSGGAHEVSFWSNVYGFGSIITNRKIIILQSLQIRARTPTQSSLPRPWLNCYSLLIALGNLVDGFIFQLFRKSKNIEKHPCLQSVCLFSFPKPFVFLSGFHWLLIFFQNLPQGALLEGLGADDASTGRFGCHFRFTGFPKRHPLAFQLPSDQGSEVNFETIELLKLLGVSVVK